MNRPQKSQHGGNQLAFKNTDATSLTKTCVLCQQAEGTARRRTMRGNTFHLCETCQGRIDLTPISQVLQLMDTIDAASAKRQAVRS